jgi:hypothetical protein
MKIHFDNSLGFTIPQKKLVYFVSENGVHLIAF